MDNGGTSYSRLQALTEGQPTWAQDDRGLLVLGRPALLATHETAQQPDRSALSMRSARRWPRTD